MRSIVDKNTLNLHTTKLSFTNCAFQNIFNSYLNVPEDIKDFHEVASKLKYSKLSVAIDKGTSFPKRFGWLTEIGIYTGEVGPNAWVFDESKRFLTLSSIYPCHGFSPVSKFVHRSTNKPSHRNSFVTKSSFRIQVTMKKTAQSAHRPIHSMQKVKSIRVRYRSYSPNSMRSFCTPITSPYSLCSTIKLSTKSI